MSVRCSCGPHWLTGARDPCTKHPPDVAPGTPAHNVDQARRSFPALAEDVRRHIRVNGNYAPYEGE
jgi:hypothetical protein